MIQRDLEAEIGLHLDLRTERLVRAGLAESDARTEALRRFGGAMATRHLYTEALSRERRMRMRGWLDGFGQDLAYAVRTVVREPALSAVIVVTLALGIGANATMFGLIDRLLLRGPAHVTDSGALYRFYRTTPASGSVPVSRSGGRTTDVLGYVSYKVFRDGTHSFDGIAAYRVNDGIVGQGATAAELNVGSATADFFPLLGVSAQVGRFFDDDEDRPGAAQDLAVLGHDLWQSRFGGARDVTGQTLMVNDQPYTIIGVAPRAFTGVDLERVDVWLPMSAVSPQRSSNWQDTWNASWLNVVGRLKPGVTAEQAGLDATAAQRAAYTGRSERLRESTIVIHPVSYGPNGSEPLEMVVSRWLLAVATIVLLIACANVMNLLLARSVARRQEVAVRLALGISRGRLFRLLVLHGLVLAGAGGALALLFVRTGGPVTRRILLPDVLWTGTVDSHVVLFTAMMVLVVGALTSAVPALRAGRRNVTTELKSGAREGGGRRSPLRTGLAMVQVTLTVVLLIGAGLFSRSLSTVSGLDLGVEPDRVLTVAASWATPPVIPAGTDPADAWRVRGQRSDLFYAQAVERVRAMPGVSSAAVAIGTPFQSLFSVDLRVSGHDSIPPVEGGGPFISAVTAGYFETTGLDLLDGRSFTQQDRAGSEPVAIVNRTMADALWPAGALGECIYMIERDPEAACSRIVGIVADANRFGLREAPAMQFYVPLGQEAGIGGTLLLVRPAGRIEDPKRIAAIRAALYDLDPGLSFVSVHSLQEQIDPQVRPWKLGATLFSLFGGLALLIAAIGLYSVIACLVAERTHEMGVRKALGAGRGTVLTLVLRRSTWLVAAGLALGTAIAFYSGRFIQDTLFETDPHDPMVFAGVALITVVVATLASLLPAWRASTVDPAVALRAE